MQVATVDGGGWDIKLTAQPANSSDKYINDLSFVWALASKCTVGFSGGG